LDVTPEEMEAAKKMPLNLYDFPLFDRRWLFGLLLFLGLWLSGRDETECPVKAGRVANKPKDGNFTILIYVVQIVDYKLY